MLTHSFWYECVLNRKVHWYELILLLHVRCVNWSIISIEVATTYRYRNNNIIMPCALNWTTTKFHVCHIFRRNFWILETKMIWQKYTCYKLHPTEYISCQSDKYWFWILPAIILRIKRYRKYLWYIRNISYFDLLSFRKNNPECCTIWKKEHCSKMLESSERFIANCWSFIIQPNIFISIKREKNVKVCVCIASLKAVEQLYEF